MTPEQQPTTQPPQQPTQDPSLVQSAATVSQTILPPTPKKSSLLWLWLLLGFLGLGIVIVVVAVVLLVVVGRSSDSESKSSNTSSSQSTVSLTTTPCYSLNTAGLDVTTKDCDLSSLVDNGGYFPGIEILTYQKNSYGTFDAFKVGYEKELRADSSIENVTAEATEVDGVEAMRYEYQRKPKSNVTEVNIGAEEGFRTTYIDVWVNIEGVLDYEPATGGPIKAFAIRGDNSTQSVEATFNTALNSIRWQKQ